MGKKTILNECIAYLDMSAVPDTELGTKGRLIMTYAMCGFANPGSVGTLVGGLGEMVPERRAEIAELGLRSLLAGTIVTLMTGAVAAFLLWP